MADGGATLPASAAAPAPQQGQQQVQQPGHLLTHPPLLDSSSDDDDGLGRIPMSPTARTVPTLQQQPAQASSSDDDDYRDVLLRSGLVHWRPARRAAIQQQAEVTQPQTEDWRPARRATLRQQAEAQGLAGGSSWGGGRGLSGHSTGSGPSTRASAEVASQAATAWPLAGTEGPTAALAAIVLKVGALAHLGLGLMLGCQMGD